jgi:hypothetical protein
MSARMLLALVVAQAVGWAVLARAQDPEVRIRAELARPTMYAHETAVDGLRVTASAGAGVSLDAIQVTVEVKEGDALLRDAGGEWRKSMVAKTDAEGKAAFTLQVGAADPKPMLAISAEKTGVKCVVERDRLVVEVRAYPSAFASERVTSELILGVIFQDEYSAEGQSKGFGDQQFLGQLSFDTLWPLCKRKSGARCAEHSGSAWHTRLDLRFSSFPVTDTETGNGTTEAQAADSSPETFSDVADSFSPTLVAMYQPAGLAIYSASSSQPGRPYDAFRLGFLIRAGFTNRDKVSEEDEGDTLIGQFGVGVRFTHHQTAASTREDDTTNVLPLRYVEASLVRFEEFAGRRNTNRVVLEAALRLPGLGTSTLPFYAGVYANVGEGPDDVRVFAAFVFGLDRLPTMFGM